MFTHIIDVATVSPSGSPSVYIKLVKSLVKSKKVRTSTDSSPSGDILVVVDALPEKAFNKITFSPKQLQLA
jgi:hypothetical protein